MSRKEKQKWNQTYRDGTRNPRVTGPPSPVVDAALAVVPGRIATALDVGAGLLRHARVLAERGYRVLAVDVAREAFRSAGPRPPTVFPVVLDLDGWRPPPASFDVIVDVHYLNRDLAPHLARALRPGGRLLLEIRVDEAAAPDGSPHGFRLAPGEAPTLFADLDVVAGEERDGLARYVFGRPDSERRIGARRA